MQERQQIQLEYSSHPNFSEGWHIGGDAYTAVAVAKKTGTGSWVVYNIFRDHLGTITHLKNGSTIDEYSFDAWGRRRDKDNWSYTLSGEPALFADRGFTCHEFLSDFNLYNMNGRLYDPVVGRFLSPDPYIADPSFTQSYNRYSYVLNNPLKYNDPTGELPFIAWLGIAWAGNYLMGVADNHINKGMSVKDAFRNTNFVAGVNFSPSDMSRSSHFGFSSIQVDAQKAALHEEKMTAYLTAIERSLSGEGNPARGGGQTNWGLYLTGAVLTAEDVYNNFGHNHTTYTTTGGVTKNIYKANGAVRSARAAQFASTSTAVKVLGTTGTVLMTGVATYNIVDAVSNNRSVSGWDIADGSVGAVGLTGAGLTSVGVLSNPVGWGIGAGVATYSWFRLWYDLGAKYGPSKW